MIEDMPKHLSTIFEQMCLIVGANPKEINPLKPDWFTNYSWTAEEQECFKKWLSNYLYYNKSAREAIMVNPVRSRKSCDLAASFFVFSYGWELK